MIGHADSLTLRIGGRSVVHALSESCFADVEWHSLLVCADIGSGSVRADTAPDESLLDDSQKGFQMSSKVIRTGSHWLLEAEPPQIRGQLFV